MISILDQISKLYNINVKYLGDCDEVLSNMERTYGNIDLYIELNGAYLIDDDEISNILDKNLKFSSYHYKVIRIDLMLIPLNRTMVLRFTMKVIKNIKK